jgi:hypothetical protein
MSAAASKRVKVDEPLHTVSSLFSFGTKKRMVCSADGHVKYKENEWNIMWSLPMPMLMAVVAEEEPELKRQKSDDESTTETTKPTPTLTFESCLDSWAADTTFNEYRWPHLGNHALALTVCAVVRAKARARRLVLNAYTQIITRRIVWYSITD